MPESNKPINERGQDALEAKANVLKAFTVSLVWLILAPLFLQAQSHPLRPDMTCYKAQAGLSASVEEDTLLVIWEGADQDELRLRFVIKKGVPTIAEIALRPEKGEWRRLAADVVPEFRIVSGTRRVTQQQTEPLEELGITLTAEKLNEIKWNAFWDAPLYLEQKPPPTHQNSIPTREAFANHPGMPRDSAEVVRATAVYRSESCQIRTDGIRLEILFPGVEAGIFEGHLRYTIFKGSNLIRQMLVAKTDHPSAAFKYDAGLSNMPVADDARVVWRSLADSLMQDDLGDMAQDSPNIVKGNNRMIATELSGGSLALFPPPHHFYWARETEQNLGYGWYKKDNNSLFSLGIRQAELEEDPEFFHNFALYNARPGTPQYMPLFLYLSAGSGEEALDAALAFTHGDRFKPLADHKVMGHHYHVGLVKRLKENGGFNKSVNDIATVKEVGIDIYGVIDGARGPGRHDKGDLYLNDLAEYYEAARSQSDTDFLVMPNDENSTGGRPPFMGGHYDIIPSNPLFWRPKREPGQALSEKHPLYGTVYNLGSPADMMEMAQIENVLISMPHPRAKGSTGYPDTIKDEPQFLDKNYFALGYRWGMGIDASERRLGESRFLPLWNETNNWMAARDLPPKFALAISEARSDYGDRGKPPEDDVYGMSPVNYLKIDEVPTVDDMSPIVDALKNGEYFVTTGEVLIPRHQWEGTGLNRSLVAEVEWTFPLDFVELVWGDSKTTERQIISTTDLPAFGKKTFRIPFDTRDKKWIRFAAWDVAGNGAMLQPVFLITENPNPKP